MGEAVSSAIYKGVEKIPFTIVSNIYKLKYGKKKNYLIDNHSFQNFFSSAG
jgi:hypothetical protein